MTKGNGESSEESIAKLIEMGFEKAKAIEAVKNAGLSIGDGIEYILNGFHPKSIDVATNSSTSSASDFKTSGQKRQSSILDHFRPNTRAVKRAKSFVQENYPVEALPESFPVHGSGDSVTGCDWEEKAKSLLKKHFGYTLLKSFQREALAAWMSGQDCLVLAATGSGETLMTCLVH